MRSLLRLAIRKNSETFAETMNSQLEITSATFASNTKSRDDKGRSRRGACLLRREQD